MYDQQIVLGTLYPASEFNIFNIKSNETICQFISLKIPLSDNTTEIVDIKDRDILLCQKVCTDFDHIDITLHNEALPLYDITKKIVEEAIDILIIICKYGKLAIIDEKGEIEHNPSSYALALMISLQINIDIFEYLSDLMRSIGYKYYKISEYIGIPYTYSDQSSLILNNINGKISQSKINLQDLDGEFIFCRQEPIKVFGHINISKNAQILLRTGNVVKYTFGSNTRMKGTVYKRLILWTCEDWLKRKYNKEYLDAMIKEETLIQ